MKLALYSVTTLHLWLLLQMIRLVEYEWREVPEFPDYEVTSLGHIRRKKTKVAQAVNLTGTTETVQLTKDGKRYHRTLASVVKATFPGVLYP